jgi:DNA modification methylase
MDILDKLKLNPKNPRRISKDEKERLKDKILNFPKMLEKRPIVYDENFIVLGRNQRLTVVRELVKEGFELKKEYFSSCAGWTNEEKRKFIILDNISDGDWDYELIRKEWSDLPLQDWGIDQKKWDNGETEQDEPPKVLSGTAKSILGEIYQLGEHRVMCGSATDAANMKDLLGGGRADMVFTDPPYNVDYTGKTKDALKIENDKMGNDTFYQFLYDAFVNISISIKSGASIYVCHADSEGLNFRKAFIDAKFLLKQCIIWNKNSMVMGRQDYQWKHEPILYGWLEGGTHSFYGGRDQTTVWDIARPSVSKEHPTMKPIALIDRALKNSSKSGDIILDAFGGSGSTLIACQQTKRICYMMELDPHYVDVIRKRYYKFTHNNDDKGWENGTPVIK